MHPAIKIAIGALMVVLGVFSSVTFWNELLLVVQAGIGPLLLLVGAFIIWLESDEWKMRRTQSQEEARGVEQFTDAGTSEEEPEQEVEGHRCGECGKTFDTERGMHIHQAQKHE